MGHTPAWYDEPASLRGVLREAIEELAQEEYCLGTLYDQPHTITAPMWARVIEARAHVNTLVDQIALALEAREDE
jgi:hypothetical protein